MINMKLDVEKIFQQRLAESMGMDKYRYVMENIRDTDISRDKDFQRIFNGFYIVRRNEEWRKIFYTYFERIKNDIPSFENIITYLYENTGNLEPSFASKMLATILPEKPIWDRYVVQNLELRLEGKTKQEKLEHAVTLYRYMEQWYADFLQTDQARECIEIFDKTLPDYRWLSDVKKVDCILWSIR